LKPVLGGTARYVESRSAVLDCADAARTIDLDVDEAYAVIERLTAAGIDMQKASDQLLEEGVQKFADSFDRMIADIDAKRATYTP
jgi:transaldolase/glucose-6-phosphate isomerase